jgi:hypothetical protein
MASENRASTLFLVDDDGVSLGVVTLLTLLVSSIRSYFIEGILDLGLLD